LFPPPALQFFSILIICIYGEKEETKSLIQKSCIRTISCKSKGGGLIKIEAWENQKGEIVKYSMAYINHLIYGGDNVLDKQN